MRISHSGTKVVVNFSIFDDEEDIVDTKSFEMIINKLNEGSFSQAFAKSIELRDQLNADLQKLLAANAGNNNGGDLQVTESK